MAELNLPKFSLNAQPGFIPSLADAQAMPPAAPRVSPLSAPPPTTPIGTSAQPPGLIDRLSTAPGQYFQGGMQALGQGNIPGAVGGVVRSVAAAPMAAVADIARIGRPLVSPANELVKGF